MRRALACLALLLATGPLLRHFLNAMGFAIGSAVIAITLGLIQAWIAERTDTPLRR